MLGLRALIRKQAPGGSAQVGYRVVFYSPDRHIEYDGKTPYVRGIGGGVTSRVRMARALRRTGHHVTMVINCSRRTRINGVEFIPLAQARAIETDVLILNTSGGSLDLTPFLELQVSAAMTIVWISGTTPPRGLDRIACDWLYAKSNFLREVAHHDWGVPRDRIFVCYNGFDEDLFARAERRSPRREPFRLVYFSHPSKGLDTALAVLKQLRVVDPRFHLIVFGGAGLWGEDDDVIPAEPGLIYRGLVGQTELARELLGCSFSLCLQARQEPFGMVVIESMRAGCAVLASSVGAYPELIRDSEDGFLIEGDHRSAEVQSRAASLILRLAHLPNTLAYVRRNAQSVIWDTDTMARTWEGHWDWWLGKSVHKNTASSDYFHCIHCDGQLLWLADGYHCPGCGRYARGTTS